MRKLVLTFDDTLQSHATFIAPLLRCYCCSGTFFFTPQSGLVAFSDTPEPHMGLSGVTELYGYGFEIGNHTWWHKPLKPDKDDIVRVNVCLDTYGIIPTSFAYPGWGTNNDYVDLVKELGFARARTGYTDTCDIHYVKNPHERKEVLYYNKDTDLFRIPVAGVFNDVYTLDMFKAALDNCPQDAVPVFAAHSFAKPERKLFMRKALEYAVSTNWIGVRLCDV